MKKCVRNLVICFLLVSLFSCMRIDTVSCAKVNKKSVHKAYEKELKKVDKKWNKFFKGSAGNGAKYFTYYDLNKDGIEECFVVWSWGTEDSIVSCGGTDVAIYTYYKGKVKKLVHSLTGGGTWGAIKFYKNRKYIDFYEKGGWTYAADVFKTLKKGKLASIGKSEKTLDSNQYNKTGKQVWSYKINGKDVSQKKYEAYQKNKVSEKGLKMYKLTNANLKKYR